MKALKFLKNSSGISLVEVMMAVSVVGGLSLTVAQLMKNTSENVKQNEAKSENINLKAMVQDTLGNTVACKYTLNAVINAANLTAMTGAGRVTVPNIRDKGNSIRYSTASTNLAPLTITSISLTNYLSSSSTADLLIEATFKKSTSVIVMVKPIRIPINLSIDGSSALVTCSAMAVGGEWLLGGNAGTVDGTDYLGTSDNQPLNFRVNTQKAGRITSTGETYLGYRAGNSITSGTNNTIIGANAVFTGTTTIQNTTAIGTNALYSTTSTSNTAIGNASMYRDTTGQDNVAVGHQTLYNNTIGNGNVAVGIHSLYNNTGATHNNTAIGTVSLFSNTSGQGNTGLGQQSLYLNTTGSQNTAVGQYALRSNTTSNSNTSVGGYSLFTNTTGSSNVALGTEAGYFNSNGSFNTYIGHLAGFNVTTGSRNIFIGFNSATGVANSSNKLYIETSNNTTPLIGGDFSARTVQLSGTTTFNVPAYTTAIRIPNRSGIRSVGGVATDAMYIDNRVLFRDAASGGTGFVGIAGGLGIGGGSYWDGSVVPAQGNVMIQGNVGIGTQSPSQKLHVVGNILATGTITPSDRRLKENIKPLQNSLKNISQVNGVIYQRRDRKVESEKEIGVMAQDVKAVYPELISNFTHTDGKKYSAVNYGGLIGPVIEAIKELYAKVMAMVTSDEKQNIELEKIKVESLKLKAENEKLKADLKNQAQQFDQRMKKIESDIAKIK